MRQCRIDLLLTVLGTLRVWACVHCQARDDGEGHRSGKSLQASTSSHLTTRSYRTSPSTS